jgi:hypothetical protein
MLWARIETNIAEFLATIDSRRHIYLRFEELVTRPAEAMVRVTDWLGLPFDAAMLDPQAQTAQRMTDGLQVQSRMIGDPKFHGHTGISAWAADQWKRTHRDDFLAEDTVQLARSLGHDTETRASLARPDNHITTEI